MKKFNRNEDRRSARQSLVKETLVSFADDTPAPFYKKLALRWAGGTRQQPVGRVVPAWSAELQLSEDEIDCADFVL